MFATTHGTHVPARQLLLALVTLLMASTSIAARADDGMVDVRTLPRLEGAVEDTSRTRIDRLNYNVSTVVAITTAATRKLLASNGWQEFVYPDPSGHPMSFKKGQQGLTVTFSQGLGRPDQSVVYYGLNRLYNNVPFPQDASDIVFDDRRPYLSCLTATTIEASLDLFQQGLVAAGWTALSAADIAARWPNAKPDPTMANGAVVKPDQAQLAFTTPDGPATLKLGRNNGETSVNLAQKYPAVAAKADFVPKPGQAKLVFGNLGGSEATVSINKQTIRIAMAPADRNHRNRRCSICRRASINTR